MRRFQLFIIFVLGGLSILFEFQNVEEWTVFGGNLFDSLLLFALCVLTVLNLFKSSRQYRQHKNFMSFLPSATGLLFLAVIFGHMLLRSHYDNSPTVFTATNYDLGNDGGFSLDFKRNNYLKGRKIDHFSTTTYWGTYTQQGDTFVLNIPLDFKMGRQAVFQDSILRFIDDTIKFYVSRQ